VVLWRGARAAANARDAFGTHVASGLTVMFALQAQVNVAVVLGAVPAKGLTLPFVSYGGTSLVVSLFFVGLILNVSKRAPLPPPRMEGRLQNALSNRKKRRAVRVVV
jgi:cell division protein FtsW